MNEMGYVLAALLLSLVLIRRGMLKLSRQNVVWYTDPVVLLTGTWVIQSIAYALPIFINREHVEARHILYILLCHTAFLIGVLLVPRASRPKGAAADELKITLPMLVAIGCVGVLGTCFAIYDGLATSRVGLWERLSGEGLETIRIEKFANSALMRGGPFASFEFLSSASTVYVCLIAAGIATKLELKRWQLQLLIAGAFFSMVMVAFNALLIQGGRMGIILLVMGAILGALMDPKRTMFQYINQGLGRARGGVYTLLIFGALSSVWFFATTFIKDRIGETPPLVSLYQYHRASPSPLIEDLMGGNEEMQYALLSFSYLTVPLTTFTYYYDMPNGQFPGPYWGQYNFSGPVTFAMRRMGQVKEQQTVTDIRLEATRYLRVMGYGDNVWPTLLRDLALDVGWTAVPVVMFLLGFFAEMIMRSARQEGNFLQKVLGLLTAVLLVFSIAHSLLIIETFQKAFWVCFAVLIYLRVAKALRPTSSSPGNSLSEIPNGSSTTVISSS